MRVARRTCGRFNTSASGKSLPIIGNHVKPQNKKYFASAVGQISGTSSAVSCPHEGRFAVVTKRWARDAMDALASGVIFHAGRERQNVRPSRVVLTPRCWRQVLKKLTLLRGDGDNKPAPPGRSRSKP